METSVSLVHGANILDLVPLLLQAVSALSHKVLPLCELV